MRRVLRLRDRLILLVLAGRMAAGDPAVEVWLPGVRSRVPSAS